MSNRYVGITPLDRFEEKYTPEPNSGCWIWLSAVSTSGYGRMFYHGKNSTASRVSWMLFRGTIPAGLHVLHTCDNRLCVNPDHLFLGTNKDNCVDKAKKGRVPHSILDANSVRRIRRLRASGYKYSEIAKRFLVTEETIFCAVKRRSWAHVE